MSESEKVKVEAKEVRSRRKLLRVECGTCGWIGRRAAGKLVQCPRCASFAAFQPEAAS